MVANQNHQIRMAARPEGMPRPSDFALTSAPIPDPGTDEVLVRGLWLSLDPYMRGRMADAAAYTRPLESRDVMIGGVVGEVVRSNAPAFSAGDIFEGRLGWQEYALAKATEVRHVDPDLAPLSTALGVLGMPGCTAYFGLLEVGRPEPGETVLVSAAAGTVGAIVGQIAKIKGCRVVGIAGSEAKIDYLTGELGFDAGVNYKTGDLGAALDGACPDGVNVYFDNVGGTVTDTVIPRLAQRGRVVVCGQISEYNLDEPPKSPNFLRQLLFKRARMEGVVVFDYAERTDEALSQLGAWLKSGELKYKEDIVDGLEAAPAAFIRLMTGENFGKVLVRLGAPG